MTINKIAVFTSLMTKLELSLVIASKAADTARDLATHEQSKPETQYDTVGLEASYLAHGQSQRVVELQAAIEDWKTLQAKVLNEDSEISAGALVQVVNSDNKFSWYLLGNFAGGLKLNVEQIEVHVITLSSPIGQALNGKQVGDEFVHPVQENIEIEVITIF